MHVYIGKSINSFCQRRPVPRFFRLPSSKLASHKFVSFFFSAALCRREVYCPFNCPVSMPKSLPYWQTTFDGI